MKKYLFLSLSESLLLILLLIVGKNEIYANFPPKVDEVDKVKYIKRDNNDCSESNNFKDILSGKLVFGNYNPLDPLENKKKLKDFIKDTRIDYLNYFVSNISNLNSNNTNESKDLNDLKEISKPKILLSITESSLSANLSTITENLENLKKFNLNGVNIVIGCDHNNSIVTTVNELKKISSWIVTYTLNATDKTGYLYNSNLNLTELVESSTYTIIQDFPENNNNISAIYSKFPDNLNRTKIIWGFDLRGIVNVTSKNANGTNADNTTTTDATTTSSTTVATTATTTTATTTTTTTTSSLWSEIGNSSNPNSSDPSATEITHSFSTASITNGPTTPINPITNGRNPNGLTTPNELNGSRNYTLCGGGAPLKIWPWREIRKQALKNMCEAANGWNRTNNNKNILLTNNQYNILYDDPGSLYVKLRVLLGDKNFSGISFTNLAFDSTDDDKSILKFISNNNNNSNSKNKVTTKVVVGVVIGIMLLVIGLLSFAFYYLRRKRKNSAIEVKSIEEKRSELQSLRSQSPPLPPVPPPSQQHSTSIIPPPSQQNSASIIPLQNLTTNGTIYVAAMFDYEGKEETELTFRKGDVIEVIERGDGPNDWWKGKLNGIVGDFPGNYVKLAN